MKQSYKDSFFYRLLNVLHFISLSFCVLVTLYIAHSILPQKNIDFDKSQLICDDGGKFALSDVEIYFKKDNKLDGYNDQVATGYCQSHPTRIITIQQVRVSFPQLNKKPDQYIANIVHDKLYPNMPLKEFYQRFGVPNLPVDLFAAARELKEKSYTLSISYTTWGSWRSVILTLLIGLVGSYLLLHFIKEALLYIVYGKRISFPFF